MSSLGEEFPKQQARCRELLLIYHGLGPIGAFGLMMIKQVLERADQAAVEQDITKMMRSYEEMKGCK